MGRPSLHVGYRVVVDDRERAHTVPVPPDDVADCGAMADRMRPLLRDPTAPSVPVCRNCVVEADMRRDERAREHARVTE